MLQICMSIKVGIYLFSAVAFLKLGKPIEADIMFGNALNINPKKGLIYFY